MPTPVTAEEQRSLSRRWILPALAMVLCLCSMAVCRAASIVINEVVVDPQQDWNDTAGGDAIPFNAIPGDGFISAADEWIELYNASGTTIDLNGWTLEMVDSSPAVITFGMGTETLVFSSGSLDSFPPGAYLVIGNPPGDMTLMVRLTLRDTTATIIDEVHIGGTNQPVGDATGPADEALARMPNAYDTDNDLADFIKQSATINASNGLRPPSFTRATVTGDTFSFRISYLATGASYFVEEASSPAAPAAEWNPAIYFTATAGETNFSRTAAVGEDRIFLRVRRE